MATVAQNEQVNVVGIELRTSNAEAFTTIPQQWQRFFQEGVLEQIPNKLSDDVYALYTNFENPGVNNEGSYSFIIGARVANPSDVPSGMTSAVIPPSKREVFEVAHNKPENVGATWQQIWGNSDLRKSFICDYELYEKTGKISILIGVK